jgi:hypothetical protein
MLPLLPPPTAPWNGGPNRGFGSAGKDAVVGPGIFNGNLALFKSIPLRSHEGIRLEIRFESFNPFNHTELNALLLISTLFILKTIASV